MLLQGTLMAALLLGLMLAVVATGIVVFALLSAFRPGLGVLRRVVIAALTSLLSVAIVVAMDLAMDGSGWSFAIRYVQVVMGAAVLAVAYLLVRRFR